MRCTEIERAGGRPKGIKRGRKYRAANEGVSRRKEREKKRLSREIESC